MKCQHNSSRGPCNNPAKPGSDLCRQHSRDRKLSTAYRLTDSDLQESVDYHAQASLLDISEQIVLLRSLVERRLNMASDNPAEQITAFNFVATQLANLTKMTETLVKLGKESGDLMSKADVENYVDSVIGIVVEEIKDVPNFEDRVDRINTRIEDLENKNE